MDIKRANKAEWDDLFYRSPNACFFHSRLWYELWRFHESYTYLADIIESSGGRFLAPYYVKHHGLRRKPVYTSGPVGTYGSVISEGEINQAQVRAYLFALKRSYRQSNPFAENYLSAMSQQKADSTFVLALDELNDDFSSNWTKKHLESLEKAKSSNLEFSAETTLTDWEEYAALYEEVNITRGRAASNNYSKDIFYKLFALPDLHRKLFTMRKRGKLVSGGIFFTHNNMMHYWHGASSSDGKKMC